MGKKNIWTKVFSAGAAAVLVLSSCSTALMKTSPFYTGRIIAGKTSSGQIVRWDDPEAVKIEKILAADIKAEMDDDRIYVWPLFYKNFLMYSFLWPLAEINDVGWEVRPFVSADNYNKEYRILTGGWNGKEGSSYIIPFYVRDKNSFYSFPYSWEKDGEHRIYNYFLFSGYFSKDSSSYLFPLYYYNGTDKRLYTLLFSFGKRSGYIFPFYFYDVYDMEKGMKEYSYSLLPPFGQHTVKSGNGSSTCLESYFFPFYSYRFDKVYDGHVNPKYKNRNFSWKNRPKDYWVTDESMEKSFFMLPGIYFMRNADKKASKNVVFPFYFSGGEHYRNRDEDYFNIFPLFFSGTDKSLHCGRRNDKEWVKSFPLFMYERDRKDVLWNFLVFAGKTVDYKKGAKDTKTFCFPLFIHEDMPVIDTFVNPKYKSAIFAENKKPSDYFITEKSRETRITTMPFNYYRFNKKKQQKNFMIFPFWFSGYDKYRDKDNGASLLLPFYFSTWDKSLVNGKKLDNAATFILPFYTYVKEKDNIFRTYMMFAGSGTSVFNGRKYDSSYIFPAYSHGYREINQKLVNPKYEGVRFNGCRRPEDYILTEKTIGERSYFFPSFYSTSYEDGKYSKNGFFPFYASCKDIRCGRDIEYNNVFPFYSRSRNGRDTARNYMLLAGSKTKYIKGEKYDSSYFLPFYWYDYIPEKTARSIKKHKDGNTINSWKITTTVSRKSFIFPNIFTTKNKEKQESYLNVFPFLTKSRDKTHERTSSLFYLYTNRINFESGSILTRILGGVGYYYHKTPSGKAEFIFPNSFSANTLDGKYSSRYFFPFYSGGYDKRGNADTEWTAVYPFYSYKRDKEHVSKNYMFLAGTEDTKISGKPYSSSYLLPFYWYAYRNGYRQNYVFPNYFSSKALDGSGFSYSYFPFVFYSKNTAREKFGTPFSVYQHEKSFTDDSERTQLFWYAYYFNRTQNDVTKYIFPSYYSYTDRRKNHTVTNFFPFTFHEKTETLDSFGTFLWLYSSRKDLKEKKTKRQAFWYLYHNLEYDADKVTGQEHYESSKVLWKVYQRESKGKTTNIDIFPFISYSSTPERTRFSFAWRFFSVEKSAERTKLHLLFIPVWW